MTKITNLIQTDSELLTGFSRHSRDNHWQGFSQNWNLLLVTKGDALLEYNGCECHLPERTLAVISPLGRREFTTIAPWDCHWIHFDREPYMTEVLEWRQVIPGVWAQMLAKEDYPVFHRLFVQVAELALRRERFWRRLIYCLIQEIVLRGNMVFGRALGPADTNLAHKMLLNLQENLSMDEIARRCCLSRSAFFAKFTATFAVSPRKYRENHLMRTIQTLLETTDMSISDICEQVHMNNPFYLSARFKACFGVSPREYRRKCRPQENGR
ncbi:MAG: helix-turn-helix domain-containing protein [Victivallales bacterium]|nr:helix-turn-helix domain-containing protein [Victivallales bacterium]